MTSNYAYRGVVTGIFLLSNRSWLDTSAPNHQVNCIGFNILLQIIFLLMGVLCGIHIINYAILASISGRGGPMEVHKRKTVSTWVLIHLINMLFELVFYCLSIWQIIDLYDNGPKVSSYLIKYSKICINFIQMIKREVKIAYFQKNTFRVSTFLNIHVKHLIGLLCE